MPPALSSSFVISPPILKKLINLGIERNISLSTKAIIGVNAGIGLLLTVLELAKK